MNSQLDACTIVFLTNGEVLDTILKLAGRTWLVGQIVSDECRHKGQVIPKLQQAIDDGRITVLDGSDINAADFLNLLDKYKLGDGETECLTYAISNGHIICTDDKKARNIITNLLGQDKVIGSLGLLKEAVQESLLTSVEAMQVYHLMIARGAFLPSIPLDFFD